MSSSPLLHSLSLRSQLQTLLAAIVASLRQNPPWSERLKPDTPCVVYRVKQAYPVVYRSPLLQQAIAPNFTNLVSDLQTQLPTHPDWCIRINTQQKLEFQWREGAIASYCQPLWELDWTTEFVEPLRDLPLLELSPTQLELQYCHGRCASLLAMAQRENWEMPKQPDWLQWKTESDRAFFSVWLESCDRLARSPAEHRPLLDLAQAWHQWYAQSTIWNQRSPSERSAHLALIHLVKKLLSWQFSQSQIMPWRST